MNTEIDDFFCFEKRARERILSESSLLTFFCVLGRSSLSRAFFSTRFLHQKNSIKRLIKLNLMTKGRSELSGNPPHFEGSPANHLVEAFVVMLVDQDRSRIKNGSYSVKSSAESAFFKPTCLHICSMFAMRLFIQSPKTPSTSMGGETSFEKSDRTRNR